MRKVVTTSIFSIVGSFLLAPAVLAADRIVAGPGNCEIVGDVPTLACLGQVISNVIGVAFIFVGFAALVFLLFGSIKMIVSRGDQKALQAAKGTITYALIGTIFIVLSFVIVSVVLNALGLPPLLQTFTIYQSP